MRATLKKTILIILLSIAIVLILYYLSAIFHELGHKKTAEDYGIGMSISWKIPKLTKVTQIGVANFNTLENCKSFNELSQMERGDILLAGVKYDVISSCVLIFISMLIFVLTLFLAQKSEHHWSIAEFPLDKPYAFKYFPSSRECK